MTRDAQTVSKHWHAALTEAHDLLGILSPACKENNAVHSKLGALIVLKGILALNIDVKEISKETGPMRGLPTIVEAGPVPVISGVEVEPAKS